MTTKVTRPALVIGLGGTGQWILTHLKKDLLEYNRGVMPGNVKLLAFDTIAQPQARQQVATGGTGEKDVRVGGVELAMNDEFIHLGKNNPDIYPYAKGIMEEDKHPHIAPWFQAKEYIKTLPQDAFNLSTGAGQIRQFGRMAIYNDLSQPANSAIWSRVREELKTIAGGVDANNKLEVIITGSFAGGTGAGMFIDMAILLRAIARASLNDDSFLVRGFFVLPSAFGMGGQDAGALEMQARSFAAWREMDRFMIKSPQSGVRKMHYHETQHELQVDIGNRPFDACYLIDSHRPNNPLNTVSPEEGVYPSIADVISAILDPTAGRHYTEHITTNLNPLYVQHPDVPMYSAIGSYTVKVPVYYTLEEIVHLFALDTLDSWLEPVKDNEDRITGLASAKNEELGVGKAGMSAAEPFMRRTRITRGDEGVNATIYFNHIADVVAIDRIQRERLVNTYSRPAGPQNHLLLLTNIGDSVPAKSIRKRIDAILMGKLQGSVPLSRESGEDPVDGLRRIYNAADQFLGNRFGRRLEDGSEVRGEYGDALAQCRYYQVATFRNMLAMYVDNLLMGSTEGDAVKSRKGKLGYAYDMVKSLVDMFDTYVNFLNNVEDERQKGGKSQSVYRNFDIRRDEMQKYADRKVLFGALTAPKAHKTQEDFLRSGQALADMRRDDLLILVAREIAQDMRAASVEMRNKLFGWIETLAVGTDDMPSLYDRIGVGLEYLKQGLKRDSQLTRVQKVMGESEGNLYERDYEAMKSILERIVWRVFDEVDDQSGEEKRNFKVSCSFMIDEEEAMPMDSNNIRRISEEFMANCRKEYAYVPSQKYIGEVLVEKYGPNGADVFAEEFGGMGAPLWQPEPGASGAKKLHSFVRVFHESESTEDDENAPQVSSEASAFFNEMKSHLGKTTGAQNLEVELVNSSDHYKLSIIRSDDLIPSNNFKVWNSLRKAYIDHIRKQDTPERQERAAVMLHAFPAEVNVAEYEARWAAKGRSYEIFDPEVVMVMSDKKRVRLFILAYAVGLIKLSRELRAAVLTLPGMEPVYLGTSDEGKRGIDFFSMMDTFVNYGQDVRSSHTGQINYDEIRPHIITTVEEKHESYVAFLTEQIAGGEGTLYHEVGTKLYGTHKREKYRQLAEIIKFIFEDEKAEEEQWGLA